MASNAKEKQKSALNDSALLNRSRDGFNQSSRASIGLAKENASQAKKNHKVHEHPTKGVYVEGLTEINCDSSTDAYNCLLNGLQNKRVSQTSRNVHSSRSHTIFQIKMYLKQEDLPLNVFSSLIKSPEME